MPNDSNPETSTDNQTPVTAPEETGSSTTPSTPGEAPKDGAGNLLAEVSELVKNSTPKVRTRLVETLVEKEVQSRADILSKALDMRQAASSEFRKVNCPDVVTFDVNGKEAGGTYTKERLKEIKDKREKFQKIETAIEKALSGDWSKVKELKG